MLQELTLYGCLLVGEVVMLIWGSVLLTNINDSCMDDYDDKLTDNYNTLFWLFFIDFSIYIVAILIILCCFFIKIPVKSIITIKINFICI